MALAVGSPGPFVGFLETHHSDEPFYTETLTCESCCPREGWGDGQGEWQAGLGDQWPGFPLQGPLSAPPICPLSSFLPRVSPDSPHGADSTPTTSFLHIWVRPLPSENRWQLPVAPGLSPTSHSGPCIVPHKLLYIP